jgi:SAM-dependent methyltransferase
VLQASATAAQETGPDAAYWRFYDAVARAQLTSWLAGQCRLLIDISGPASPAATLATSAGHRVLRVRDPRDAKPPVATAGTPPGPDPSPDARADVGPDRVRPAPGVRPDRVQPPPDRVRPAPDVRPDRVRPAPDVRPDRVRPAPDVGGLRTVAADASGLQFLADSCADGLIAEDRTLSRRLAAEALVAEICRVLRPGGRVIASVDSLTRGMSVLAEQNHWPHLIDLPHADVVLVPWPDGIITRCYGTEQLRELFASGGFEVHWIRPRTVLSASTVGYLLARDPGSFPRLVEAELQTSADDSVGGQLLISAAKRVP